MEAWWLGQAQSHSLLKDAVLVEAYDVEALWGIRVRKPEFCRPTKPSSIGIGHSAHADSVTSNT